jgi:hypothetical protein
MKDNGDYSDLIEYLDKKFQDTATKEDLDDFATKTDLERFATKEDLDDFATRTELYLVRDEIKQDITELNKKFDQIMNSLDRFAGLLERYFQEQVALGAKVDRHEEWIKQIAGKMGIKLEY